MYNTRECDFSHRKGCDLWHVCEKNFVVSSITMMCDVYCDMYYIKMTIWY